MFGIKKKVVKSKLKIEEKYIEKKDPNEIGDIECAHILASEIEKNIENVLNEESNITYGFQQVSKTLSETTSEIENIEESLNKLDIDTTDILNEISLSIQNSQDKIHDSRKKVDDSASHMKDVFEAFDQILKVAVSMENKYEEINEFANVITKISNQTNLLSLNAAIEATRAGQSGKGFAVVAGEMKSLSDTTQKSAKDIIRLLEEMSHIMNLLKGESDKGKQIVTIANNAMNESNESFHSIAEAEKRVNDQLEVMKTLQVDNLNEITNNFTYIIKKFTEENNNIDELILNVEKKAVFYSNIINQLNQTKKLKDKDRN